MDKGSALFTETWPAIVESLKGNYEALKVERPVTQDGGATGVTYAHTKLLEKLKQTGLCLTLALCDPHDSFLATRFEGVGPSAWECSVRYGVEILGHGRRLPSLPCPTAHQAVPPSAMGLAIATHAPPSSPTALLSPDCVALGRSCGAMAIAEHILKARPVGLLATSHGQIRWLVPRLGLT